MIFRTPLIAAAAAAGLLAVATQAEAHARLVSATPAANASTPSPTTLTLRFSEKLEPKFSGAALMKADGSSVPVKAQVGKDRKTIVADVPGKLAPGAYMVMWHVVSADGHRMKGDFSFTVR